MNISKKMDFVVQVNYPFTGLFLLRRSISGVDTCMTSLFQNDFFRVCGYSSVPLISRYFSRVSELITD